MITETEYVIRREVQSVPGDQAHHSFKKLVTQRPLTVADESLRTVDGPASPVTAADSGGGGILLG